MVNSLRDDIKQKRPFHSREHEAYLNIMRTAAALNDEVELLLKPHGITGAQFNALRILRGAESGLCRNELRDRMLTRMPDMTRLLDRMEASGLVRRERSDEDRRLVTTEITAKGRKLVDQVTASIDDLHQEQLGHLNKSQLTAVVELMTTIRNRE